MAIIYCRSTDGFDSNSGLTWALAKATLQAALTAAGAGGTVYVSNNHAETLAGTMTSPGTAASPTHVYCVDDSAEPPTALATTGAITATSAFTFAGFAYYYGLTFTSPGTTAGSGVTFVSLAPWWSKFERCKLALSANDVDPRIEVGAVNTAVDDRLLELVDTTLSFANATQGVLTRCKILWSGSLSSVLGTAPTSLFLPASVMPSEVIVRGVDLSALGSGKNLVSIASATFGRFLFENCKLGASVSVKTGTIPGQGGTQADLINCDSADTNYRNELYRYQGSILQETVIKRTNGASDGTTGVSRKMVSLAGSIFSSPLESNPIIQWNELTGGSITATIEIITDNITLTDAEAWLEIEYLGTSGFPLASFAHDRAASILATPANQTSSSVDWTTTGLVTPIKQKLSVTFTPQEKGVVRAIVKLAKASTTMYYDPLLTIA